ncbi:MAG: DNA polymerase III subunit [Clostridia bacterium]|nr:DNA polymerase III subunit [Clostridia bacterium]
MNFDNFVGNEKLKDRLSRMISSRNVPQAIVFEGKQGLGKRTLAQQFVRALLCTGADKPCMACAACAKTKTLAHPDVTIIDGSEPKSLSVDVMRDIRTESFIKPNEADYKVCVFLNADAMTEEAQNAILKILEEPPPYCVFIFTCESRSSLLQTVLSRSVCMELFPVPIPQAVDAIRRILPDEPIDKVEKAAEIFNGNIGASISSICSGEFTRLYETSLRILNSLSALDELELLRESAVFDGDKELFSGCVAVLSLAVRDAIALKFGSNVTVSGFEARELDSLKSLTAKQLMALKAELDDTATAFTRNANPTLLITRFCARMRQACGR